MLIVCKDIWKIQFALITPTPSFVISLQFGENQINSFTIKKKVKLLLKNAELFIFALVIELFGVEKTLTIV